MKKIRDHLVTGVFGRRTLMFLPLREKCSLTIGETYTSKQLYDKVACLSKCPPDDGSVRVFKSLSNVLLGNDCDCTSVVEVLSSGYIDLSWVTNITAKARIITVRRVVDPIQAILEAESTVNSRGFGYYTMYTLEDIMERMGVKSEELPDTVTEPVYGYKCLLGNMTSIYGTKKYEIGKDEVERGPLVMCQVGMHFSRRLSDAIAWTNKKLEVPIRFFRCKAYGRVYDYCDGTKAIASKLVITEEISRRDADSIIEKEKTEKMIEAAGVAS